MKHIVVISDNDLLLVGIERLLRKPYDFAIHPVSAGDENEIIRLVSETGSETIILDGSYEKNQILQLPHLLKVMKGLRLLIMQMDSNRIQIFDKREGLLDHSTNLADYI